MSELLNTPPEPLAAALPSPGREGPGVKGEWAAPLTPFTPLHPLPGTARSAPRGVGVTQHAPEGPSSPHHPLPLLKAGQNMRAGKEEQQLHAARQEHPRGSAQAHRRHRHAQRSRYRLQSCQGTNGTPSTTMDPTALRRFPSRLPSTEQDCRGEEDPWQGTETFCCCPTPASAPSCAKHQSRMAEEHRARCWGHRDTTT